jgi:hypothetical protein
MAQPNRRVNRQQVEVLPPHKVHENCVQLLGRLSENPEYKLYMSNNIPDLTDLVAFRRQHDSIMTGEQDANTAYSFRGRILRISKNVIITARSISL